LGGKSRVLLEDGTRLDASGFGPGYDEEFFAIDGLTKLRNWLARQGLPHCAFENRCFRAADLPAEQDCVRRADFRDHAEESGMEIPKEPVIF